jgi:serine/threonine-protein phosphatase 5
MGRKSPDPKKKGKASAPAPPWPLTRQDMEPLIQRLTSGPPVPIDWLETLLKRATHLLTEMPNVVQMQIVGKEKVTVVGDTHGQLADLLAIFQANGYPTRHNRYVFNGDFVDRGADGCGIVILLCAFLVLDPNTVALNRGNHESEGTTTVYGFQQEVRAKHGSAAYPFFLSFFNALPLATCLNRQVLVVHGGLWRSPNGSTLELGSLADLEGVDRHREPPDQPCALNDVLWSDPDPVGSPGLGINRRRGCGLYFGPDVLQRFLDDHGLRYLVRSHEGPDCVVISKGYRVSDDDRCITVFSARSYMGLHDNNGGYITFDISMTPTFSTF